MKPLDRSSILAHANVVNISAAAIITKDDKVLLIKERVDGKVSYNFPSGKAHIDELIEQTTKREAMEETGYSVELTDLAGIYYYRTKGNSNDRKKDRITVRFNFWCKIVGKEQSQRPTKETVSLTWVVAAELRELAKGESFRNWVSRQLAEDVLSGQKFPLGAIRMFKR
jgi:8-oxo-dGTP pyrophosphatase MutT (NUDIX family)